MHTERRVTDRLTTTTLHVTALTAAAGLIFVIPSMIGLSWGAVGDVLGQVSLTTLLALALLWVAGLLAHTMVLTAALPGLTTARALLLMLSGSAVSNLLPFGGAAGMGLGFVMTRRWGFTPAAFASFAAITHLWNVVGKLLIGSGLLLTASLIGMQLPSTLNGVVAIGSAAIVVVCAGAALTLTNSSPLIGTSLNALVNGLLARCRSGRRVDIQGAIHEVRGVASAAVAAGWGRMTYATLGYMLLQATLLGACLSSVGAGVVWQAVAVAYAVERLLTVVPLTPGGSGLAELGSVAVLVGLGVDPASAAAGVLLYRTFTFLLAIPIGGLSALVWFRATRTRQLIPA